MAIINNNLNSKALVTNNKNQKNQTKAQAATKTNTKKTSVKTISSIIENLKTGKTTTAAALKDLRALGATVTQQKLGTTTILNIKSDNKTYKVTTNSSKVAKSNTTLATEKANKKPETTSLPQNAKSNATLATEKANAKSNKKTVADVVNNFKNGKTDILTTLTDLKSMGAKITQKNNGRITSIVVSDANNKIYNLTTNSAECAGTPLAFNDSEIQEMIDSLNAERAALEAEKAEIIKNAILKCGEVVEKYLNSSMIINEATFVNFLNTQSDLSNDKKKVARELLKGYLIESGVAGYYNFDNEFAAGIDISGISQHESLPAGVRGKQGAASSSGGGFKGFLAGVASGTDWVNSTWWNSLMIACDFIPGVNVITTAGDAILTTINSLSSYLSDPESYGADFWGKTDGMTNEEAAGWRLFTDLMLVVAGLVPGITKGMWKELTEGFGKLGDIFKDTKNLRNLVDFMQKNISKLGDILKDPNGLKNFLIKLAEECPAFAQFAQSVINKLDGNQASSTSDSKTVTITDEQSGVTINADASDSSESTIDNEQLLTEMFKADSNTQAIKIMMDILLNGGWGEFTFSFGEGFDSDEMMALAFDLIDVLKNFGVDTISSIGYNTENGTITINISVANVCADKKGGTTNDNGGINGNGGINDNGDVTNDNDDVTNGNGAYYPDEMISIITQVFLMYISEYGLDAARDKFGDFGYWTGEDAQESFEELLDALEDGDIDDWFDKWGKSNEDFEDDLEWFYSKFDPYSIGGNPNYHPFADLGSIPPINSDGTTGFKKNQDFGRDYWN